jgi:hypothetical protein
MKLLLNLIVALCLTSRVVQGFAITSHDERRLTFATTGAWQLADRATASSGGTALDMVKLSKQRKQDLGIPDSEDEYSLEDALNNNTDPFITKVLAGSFILVMIALLTTAIIIPSTTGVVDGMCNPILTQGRC